jgi:sulfur-oxidizing protein SoxA
MSYRLAAMLALAALAPPAWSDVPYRESVPMIDYQPQVGGDMLLTRTYAYWRDRFSLSETLAGHPEHHWKLNWKMLDHPFNEDLHGGHIALDRGTALFKSLDANGAFSACLGAKDGGIKGLRATRYPGYRSDMGRVVGLEAAIEHCAAKQGVTLDNGSYDNSAVSLFVAHYSTGVPIAIDVTREPLKGSWERGRNLFHLKAGRHNLACASCHTLLPGHWLRSVKPTTPYGDAAHWPVYRSKGELQSMHIRFAECQLDSGVQPLRPGSQPYTDLEVFLTALTNGYPVAVPSVRD